MTELVKRYIDRKGAETKNIEDQMLRYNFHIHRKQVFDKNFTIYPSRCAKEVRYTDRFVTYLFKHDLHANSKTVGALIAFAEAIEEQV